MPYGSTVLRLDLGRLRLQVLELDELAGSSIARVRVATRSSSAPDVRRGSLGQVERAEGLLELRADAVERRVRAGRDHRADELERQPDRPRLERRQPRRAAERVAEELLVDVHLVAVQLGVDGVAAAAEVDEVEEREVLLERLGRDREPLDEIAAPGSPRRARRRRRRAGRRAATAGRRSAPARPGRPAGRRRGSRHGTIRSAAGSGGGALVRPAGAAQPLGHEPAQRRGLERDRAAVLAQDPAGEQRQRGVLGHEDVALDPVAGPRRTRARPTRPCRARARRAPRRRRRRTAIRRGRGTPRCRSSRASGNRARAASRSGSPSGCARRGSS